MGATALRGDVGTLSWSLARRRYDSPAGMYYRWRTFAFLQGDTTISWREEPFQVRRRALFLTQRRSESICVGFCSGHA